ncbi:MAG TPA: hypothetical protein VF738_14915, partial [Rhodanobacter sp.]
MGNEHALAVSDASPGLPEALPYVGPRGTGVADTAWPLDPSLPAALERRAARAGIDPPSLYQAALALLEARLTGWHSVGLAMPEPAPPAVRMIAVPARAGVDDWLRACAAAPLQADAEPSPAGAWQQEASARVPLAWSITTGASASLRLRHDLAAFDPAAAALLVACMHRVLAGLASAERLETVTACDPQERQCIDTAWNATAGSRQPADTVHGLFAEIARSHATAPALA